MSPPDISNMKNTKAVKNGRTPRKLNFQKKYIYILYTDLLLFIFYIYPISKTMLFENQPTNNHCSPQLKQSPLLCNFIKRFLLLKEMAIRV